MKSITVNYFALFRERAGCERESVRSAADTTLALFVELKDRHGTDDPRGHCKVAVNDVMADWDTNLKDGDHVLFFPPVAGG